MKLLLRTVALLAAGVGLLAAGDLLRIENSVDAMGANYAIAAYGEDQAQLEAALEAAFDEVRRLDRMLSNYRPNSEWSRINQRAASEELEVSAEMFALLEACQEYSRLSEGAFDISVGPLMRVWGFYKGTGQLPDREEVERALARTGYRHVVLNREKRTVRFTRPGVEIDPGGIGKGYAVDRMAAILREQGVKVAMISAGGSSLYGMGAPPSDARGWKVGIRNPRNPMETIEEVFLKDSSLSTSGDYEKFFVANGKLYSHIMDPRTGYPAEGVIAVSVVAPRTIDSEAWAKPVFVNGRDWAAKNLPKGFRAFVCEENPEVKCAWLP